MNYEKIKILANKQKISIKELENKIKVSDGGLNRSINNKTIKVDTLEKIAIALQIPVSTFFDEPTNVEKVKIAICHECKGVALIWRFPTCESDEVISRRFCKFAQRGHIIEVIQTPLVINWCKC